jgi:thymidylate synthase (FAD)
LIRVLEHTKNPVSFIGKCCGQCWGSDTSDSYNNFKRGKECIQSGHGRTMEYSDITIEISRYSARVMRELYTHITGTNRLQESTRYVDYSDFQYYIPDTIKSNQSALEIYEKTMVNIMYGYQQLIDLGIPKEDVANVVPLGSDTKVVLKINIRALSHMFETRECTRAYKEFRLFMKELREVLLNLDTEWKWLCDNEFKIKCEKVGFCNESHGCGKYPRKE